MQATEPIQSPFDRQLAFVLLRLMLGINMLGRGLGSLGHAGDVRLSSQNRPACGSTIG
jgi:hypothetical protein